MLGKFKYRCVTVGGTWDFLHRGHRKLLREAFRVGERVVVGVTSDEFVRKKKQGESSRIIADLHEYKERKEELEKFLQEEGWEKRAKVVRIDNIFGPLKQKNKKAKKPAPSAGRRKNRRIQKCKKIEAMVVTRETRGNAEEINRWRREKGMGELDIVKVEMELTEDGRPISSRRIRAGEINREGVIWREKRLWGELPESLRGELREPLGELIDDVSLSCSGSFLGAAPRQDSKSRRISTSGSLSENSGMSNEKVCSRKGKNEEEKNVLRICANKLLISVGDISTGRLMKIGIKPEVVVFDLRVKREKIYDSPEELGIVEDDYKIVKVKNPAGRVSEELFRFFGDRVWKKEAGRGRGIAVWIEGEEDLAVLPAVLFAPPGAVVVYGQPAPRTGKPSYSEFSGKGGLVVVRVTEKRKGYVSGLLQRFRRGG